MDIELGFGEIAAAMATAANEQRIDFAEAAAERLGLIKLGDGKAVSNHYLGAYLRRKNTAVSMAVVRSVSGVLYPAGYKRFDFRTPHWRSSRSKSGATLRR